VRSVGDGRSKMNMGESAPGCPEMQNRGITVKPASATAVRLGAATIAAFALMAMGGVAANAAEFTPDPLAAVAKATPTTLAKAADVPTTSDGKQAIAATLKGAKIVVPVDPSSGIKYSSDRGSTSVGLPFATQTDDAAAKAPGVVAYDNKNGSSTVPIVQNDGNVQINTVIRNAQAPKRYAYPLTVPAGQSIHLSPDGSAYVAAANSVPSLYIAAPWAKDAAGAAVPTHFEVNGDTLTQVVGFTAATAFPVVADPTILATGQYDYNCVLTNGSSYFMSPGSPLTNCKGSYLQKYINGVMVKSVALAYGGGATATVPAGAGGCLLAVASGVALAFFPPSGVLAWVVVGSLTAAGIVASCVSF
jgi:hypothetical protein